MAHDQFGLALRVAASFFFTVMVVCVKLTTENIPLGQIIFWRSAVALVPLMAYLYLTGDLPSGLLTKRPGAHFLRCLFGLAAMTTSFASLKFLPVADSTVIGYLTPILMLILGGVFLGEAITRARVLAVTCGFLGVLVMTFPALWETRPDGYLIGVALGLATAVITAVAKVQIRDLTKTEHPGAIAFFFALVCAMGGLISAPFGWASPSLTSYLLLVGAGVSGGLAHICMTLGLKHAETAKLAGIEYISLIFAVAADLLIFNITPGLNFLPATVLVLFAAYLVSFRDTRNTPAKSHST
ncbi:DMT family transporter [Aliiroseovarius crassostreae]|uniref:DMT family transporter n=1 Tax=Aliiroseovarius crassostreae TaxID=154981 RepID=UPI003C7C525F